jgi:hypothetical protein
LYSYDGKYIVVAKSLPFRISLEIKLLRHLHPYDITRELLPVIMRCLDLHELESNQSMLDYVIVPDVLIDDGYFLFNCS